MRSRNAAAMSTNLLPFSMYSGRLCQISSNFSGCSDASVAAPIPATASRAGRRPVRKRIAPAANEPYINTYFQSISHTLRHSANFITYLLEQRHLRFVALSHTGRFQPLVNYSHEQGSIPDLRTESKNKARMYSEGDIQDDF